MNNSLDRVTRVNIEDEMKSSYIDYSMSVIVSRALPDVRDGLKPVHRRVLYGMLELGVLSNRGYKKSARIVGEVLGKYHPHGDSSVYFSMVRMAQEWSLRYTLVDGQGNFGSIDGDSPAAMRYTEARLKKVSEEMMADIGKETVDFQLNFDDTLKEPTVLPTKFPNLLVNGASGIAVGMATNMAPHNLREVVDATVHYVKNKECTSEDLMEFIKGPDFPTGGTIHINEEMKKAYTHGKGRVIMRGKAEIEPLPNAREQIVVYEIPFMVVKSEMIKRIAEIVNQKKIEGISDIRDESDRKGMRIIFEIKRGANANVVLNNLYKFSQLQSSFSINNIALTKGRPKLLTLREMVVHFVDHRNEVILRRSQYDLDQAEKKLHILEGYLIALDNIDPIVELIKASQTPEEAKQGLMKKFSLSEIQAKAILEMRLQRLTGLERDKIKSEYDETTKLIGELKNIIENENVRMDMIVEELTEIREKYGDDRRSEITFDTNELNIEDIIPNDEMLVTISHDGYIKRTPLEKIRVQGRGGVGSKGADTKDNDWIEHMFVATNHEYLLFFTKHGKCYWQRVYELPEGGKNAKGRPIQNLVSIAPTDNVEAYLNVKDLSNEEYTKNTFVVMCTKKGVVKKTSLFHYSRPRQNGILAISIDEDDSLLSAIVTNGRKEILLGALSGKAIRFSEENVRPMGRTARGVRGILLENDNDNVIDMCAVDIEDKEITIIVVSENGYSKRSTVDSYRMTRRGGKGVKAMKTTDKTGRLVALKAIKQDDELMLVNKSGTTIRVKASEFRVANRVTQGSKLVNLKKSDSISSVEIIAKMTGDLPEENEKTLFDS